MQSNVIRKYAISCLKFIIAVVIFWYLFYSGRLTEAVLTRIANVRSLPYFLLCGVIFLVSQLIASVRLNLLLRIVNLSFSQRYVFKLTMIGLFFNNVIPGAVGGDVVKGAYLFRHEVDRRGRSAGIVLMDRIIGFSALCMIGVLSIIYLYPKTASLPSSYGALITFVLIVSVMLVLFFILMVILGRKGPIREKIKALASLLFKKSIFYHMADAVGALARQRNILAYAFFMSVALQLVTIAGLIVLIHLEAGAFPNVLDLAAASSVVMLFSIVPVTPGNIGWTELIASIGWAAIGSTSGAAVFFYWRVVSIICALPGALLYFSPQDRREHQKASIIGEAKDTV